MISPEDKQHLMNLADAIVEIQSYASYKNYEDFNQDDSAKEAVTRLLQNVGGAAKMLTDEFKEEYGDIDWNVLIGLENAMYDQAEEIEMESIWSVIKQDLPQIRDQVLDLASNLEEEDDIEGFDLTEDPKTH